MSVGSSFRSVFRGDLFRNKQIVITGGGSGIGRCVAHELVSLGGTVHLVGRDQGKLEKVEGEILKGGEGERKVFVYGDCDIRKEECVEETVGRIMGNIAEKQIHGLINNAGGQFSQRVEKISRNGFDAVLQTNLTGGFLFSKAVYMASMRQHGGSIVSITADNHGGMPGMAHSGAARAGTVNLVKTIALEWAHSGVRVNAVAPGVIASSGLSTYPEEVRVGIREASRRVPLQRLGTEEEISAVLVWLLSPASSFTTGQCLCVDGGSSLGNIFYNPRPMSPPPPPPQASSADHGFREAVQPLRGFALSDLDEIIASLSNASVKKK